MSNWWEEPYFNTLWAFGSNPDDDNVGAIDAFQQWAGPVDGITDLSIGQNIIAIIDSGVRYTHEDLADNILINKAEIPNNQIDDDQNGYTDDYYGYNFAYNNGDPFDDSANGHGTHVAGIAAAAANDLGIVGTNPAAKILPIKVFDKNGDVSYSSLIASIDYAVIRGAKVINMSLGVAQQYELFYQAIQSAEGNGCLFIVSAGNDDRDIDQQKPTYPASYKMESGIKVAASNQDGQRVMEGGPRSDPPYSPRWGSNYGKQSVDLFAPGIDIYSTVNTSDIAYGYMSGTSMATPLVAGIASSFWARNPDLSASEVKARILSNVDVPEEAFDGDTVTGGRINMERLNQDKIGISSKISSHEFTSTTNSYSHVERWQKEMDITNWITPANLIFHDSDDLKGKTIIGLLSVDIRDKEKVVNDLAKDIKTDQEELKHIDFFKSMEALDHSICTIQLSDQDEAQPKDAIKTLFNEFGYTSFYFDSEVLI
ncbi:S8 family peptidase [Prochlorococcus sp. MIT 1306]|uniref:S8 family peptidase n=1 Tax=Prochlorococcus sp. MIT 1306 TaxID=1799667 RepID=UPI0007B3B24B|nr:S8 family peptidase [Prochlorococcus sp. MIT 1306]KZR65615.1 Thermophilic serine proteinase precursor [Prochlorococcus sp. MIT 1306]